MCDVIVIQMFCPQMSQDPLLPGFIPRIVVTKEDGQMESPSPKMPPRKKESFCASLPDVTTSDPDDEAAKNRLVGQISHLRNFQYVNEVKEHQALIEL